MLYPVSLKLVAIVVGLLLIGAHLWALLQTAQAQEFIRKLPRSRVLGIVFFTIGMLWTLWVIKATDLGEFSGFKSWLFIVIPVLYGLSIRFLDDFLAVRGLGWLALLAAKPLLEAAYLRPEASRLFVVVLAYAWIVGGLFWVGMPYLMRDQVAWVQQSLTRWKVVAAAGVAYGMLLLICAFTTYR